MKQLALQGAVQQAFELAYPPAVAFSYFAQNEDLLKKFLGHEHVEKIAPSTYRIRLNRHGALGLSLQPVFDVAFIECPPDKVEMRSVDAQLLQASHEVPGFEAHFEGQALFEPEPFGTRVVCQARMKVSFALPTFFEWMPVGPLEAVGNGVIHPAMKALALRLVPLMQKDIRRWVAAQGQSNLNGEKLT
jgi:hypothetical protein